MKGLAEASPYRKKMKKGLIIIPSFYLMRHTDNYKFLLEKIAVEFDYDIQYTDDPYIADDVELIITFAIPQHTRPGLMNELVHLDKRIKMIGYMGDLQTYGDKQFELEMNQMLDRFDIILSPLDEKFKEFYPQHYHKMIFFPQFFASLERYAGLKYNKNPEMKCLMSGATYDVVYPLRDLIKRMSPYSDKIDCFHSRHKLNDEYAELLNSYYCGIATPSIFNLVVKKYFEIPAAGTLLLASECEDLKKCGFKPGKHYVPITIENVLSKIHKCIDHPEKYEEIRRAGRDFVLRKHSVENRFKTLAGVVRKMNREGVKGRNGESGKGRKGERGLKIGMFTQYDPAGVGWHLKEAINKTTPHLAIYFRQLDNYIQYPEQFHTIRDRELALEVIKNSDIVHCHLGFEYADQVKFNEQATYTIHYHGTKFRQAATSYQEEAAARSAIQFCSNLELTTYGKDINYLENPIPFEMYNKMSRLDAGFRVERKIFRIAHSPTKRSNKGTEVFLKAIEALKRKGYRIEVILIEKRSHQEALEMKVKADACFDSFWLGMQVSGLESACFEQPVLAGDELIRDKMIELYGYCPYTFVTEDTLEEQISCLIDYKQYYKSEQARVTEHVKKCHDYGPVAKKYLELIDREFKKSNVSF